MCVDTCSVNTQAALRHRRRGRATDYGSPLLARASECANALRHAGEQTPASFVRGLFGLPHLLALLLLAPRARLRLSDRPAGKRIHAHLALRRFGLPRFRLAQGVLLLPDDHRRYTRGRSRQALRTNVAKARAQGISCSRATVLDWTPPDDRRAPAAPTERWQARSHAGAPVGEAWVTVDDECALLHSMVTFAPNVRWLLHTAIVEDLCQRGCTRLLTNSHDAFLMPDGQRYFQQLLGYSVERLSPRQPTSAVRQPRAIRSGEARGVRPAAASAQSCLL